MAVVEPWGRWPRYEQHVIALNSRFEALPELAPMLPFGNGRSYGDVCLNGGGILLATRGLDRFIDFDQSSGILECEAGVLISELIQFALPYGWFPAVTPGTALVTIGGAIANDVHGKNHHCVGSFGNHVLEFELQRSDGTVLHCTRDTNPAWYHATIGGLGLTGLIRTARLQLRRVPGPWISGDSQRFSNLQAFFELSASSDQQFEYTVAWLDCVGRGPRLGRGVFTRGNHAKVNAPTPLPRPPRTVRFTPPLSPVNRLSVRIFNECYFRRRSAQLPHATWHYRPFLFPLDGVLQWNRLYGPRGLFQYQCLLPGTVAEAAEPLREVLRRVSASGLGSSLAVLKSFGAVPSLGLLSFPRLGVTLALDFPNRGETTLRVLEDLDAIIGSAGGAVYPAKDARMSARSFQRYFPRWAELQEFIDPKFSSSFWRRVSATTA